MAGYSGTPLAKKLGIKSGYRVYVENPPVHYQTLLEPLPDDVIFVEKPAAPLDLVHCFLSEARGLADKLRSFRRVLVEDGAIWVSWPKKAARVATDVTEDVIRETALVLGLVDVKVCAVDEVWSGLKLVLRLVNRKA
jgi:hypothetical protein